jgi:hypothetical protein
VVEESQSVVCARGLAWTFPCTQYPVSIPHLRLYS